MQFLRLFFHERLRKILWRKSEIPKDVVFDNGLLIHSTPSFVQVLLLVLWVSVWIVPAIVPALNVNEKESSMYSIHLHCVSHTWWSPPATNQNNLCRMYSMNL